MRGEVHCIYFGRSKSVTEVDRQVVIVVVFAVLIEMKNMIYKL